MSTVGTQHIPLYLSGKIPTSASLSTVLKLFQMMWVFTDIYKERKKKKLFLVMFVLQQLNKQNKKKGESFF